MVLIRLPGTLPGDKARPAVVVRSDLPYATVLPITTELRPGIGLRIDVAPGPRTGLREASQGMVDRPQTVRLSDMGAATGQLDPAAMRSVTRQMAIVLGIGAGTGRPRRA